MFSVYIMQSHLIVDTRTGGLFLYLDKRSVNKVKKVFNLFEIYCAPPWHKKLATPLISKYNAYHALNLHNLTIYAVELGAEIRNQMNLKLHSMKNISLYFVVAVIEY